ncbi:MAG: DUF3467 domain-containing protein [Methanosarcinaceae archaeon]|nr:DUF3467 domain-containing protein [Methanosarcinaceae archaeon]MDD4332225.1 DUF3467 domain-containing protein [Methanosarcinaceae archaeon]MDD4748912.1 DUF3467 domain-containing protein [Methanosarcinaceae archaeon]
MHEEANSKGKKESEAPNSPKKVKKGITIEFKKPADFKQIYAIGAAGGHSPYDFRIGFYNDTPKMFGDTSEAQVIERQVETEVILSPVAALELSKWLNQHISEYEAVFGPISRAVPKPKREPPKTLGDSTDLRGYI